MEPTNGASTNQNWGFEQPNPIDPTEHLEETGWLLPSTCHISLEPPPGTNQFMNQSMEVPLLLEELRSTPTSPTHVQLIFPGVLILSRSWVTRRSKMSVGI